VRDPANGKERVNGVAPVGEKRVHPVFGQREKGIKTSSTTKG